MMHDGPGSGFGSVCSARSLKRGLWQMLQAPISNFWTWRICPPNLRSCLCPRSPLSVEATVTTSQSWIHSSESGATSFLLRTPAKSLPIVPPPSAHRFETTRLSIVSKMEVESTCSREGSVVRVQSGLRQWTKRRSSVDFRDALHSELEAGFQHIGWWDFAGWCSARDLSRDASLGSQLCVGRAKWTTPSTPFH